MLSSKIFIVVGFVVLFTAYSSGAPPTNKALGKTLIKHYDFPNKNMSFNDMSYNETHLIYGLYSDSDPEINYKITLDNFDGTSEPLSCDLTIKVSLDQSKKDLLMNIALLLNDRALVFSRAGQKVKFINVNFRDCSTSEAELEVDEDHPIYSINVVPYQNSYDVFYVNSKLCQKRPCRTTFDNEGKILKDATAWGNDFENEYNDLGIVKTVARHSPAKGFIFDHARAYSFDSLAFVANSEGKKIVAVESKKMESDVTISIIGNYIGTCLSTWVDAPAPLNVLEKLECKKFDFEGNLLKTELQVNTTSLVSEEKKIRYLTRLNLPEGFILFTVLCPHNYGGICTNAESYVAYHVDGNGKTLKSIEINDFKCGKGRIFMLPRSFVSDAGHRCFTMGCYHWPLHTLTLGVRCFTENEL